MYDKITKNTRDTSQFHCLQTIADRSLREGHFAVSLDGKTIAIKLEGKKEGKINLWRLGASIFSCRESSGEDFLANLERAGQATQLSLRHNAKSIAISCDSLAVASGGSDDLAIQLWQIGNDRPFHALVGHPNSVVSVAFSLDGSTLAGGCYREIKLWNLDKYQPIQDLECPEEGWIDSVAFSSDGGLLGAAAGHKIYFWEWKTQHLTKVFSHAGSRIYSLAFRMLKSQHQIVCGLDNGEIILLELKENNLSLKSRFFGHGNRVHFLAFSSDQQTLLSGSLDGTIKMWKVSPPSRELPYIPPGANPSDVFNYEPKYEPKSTEPTGVDTWRK